MPVVGEDLPLSEIIEAHEAVTKGKVINHVVFDTGKNG